MMLRPGVSLAGVTEPVEGGGPRALIEWAAGLGYRAVQIDATMSGVRPRELDRSGRRDLAAVLRRLQLGFSGLDLWVPPSHFVDAANQDRAVSAVVAALEMSADLARLADGEGAVVSVTLPEKTPDGVLANLRAAGDRVGAVMADHQWPWRGAQGALGSGIDPAVVLAGRGDPATEVSRMSEAPASARVSDFAAAARVAVGRGGLDLLAYQVALMTKGYKGYGIVDLRGVRGQEEAAKAALQKLTTG